MKDLSSISCHAASEIDNYILGRNNDFPEVSKLAEILNDCIIHFPNVYSDSPAKDLIKNNLLCGDETIYPDYSPEEKVGAAFYLALVDSYDNFSKEISQSRLVSEAENVVGTVEKFIGNPRNLERSELEDLMKLCLSISENAMGLESPHEDSDRGYDF